MGGHEIWGRVDALFLGQRRKPPWWSPPEKTKRAERMARGDLDTEISNVVSIFV